MPPTKYVSMNISHNRANNPMSPYISRENHSYFRQRKLFAYELEILEMLCKQAMFMMASLFL